MSCTRMEPLHSPIPPFPSPFTPPPPFTPYSEPYTSLIRDAIRTRYTLLPYLYTLFRTASTAGTPVMRPLWMEFPAEEALFDEEREFMLGPSILVQPVVDRVWGLP